MFKYFLSLCLDNIIFKPDQKCRGLQFMIDPSNILEGNFYHNVYESISVYKYFITCLMG